MAPIERSRTCEGGFAIDLEGALSFQDSILQGVSRTFALTIPSLPEALRVPVTNAYLLCRIADTIEDDAEASPLRKQQWAAQFVEVLAGAADASAFGRSLAPKLGPATLADERRLIEHTDRVVQVTHSFDDVQRHALERCVRLMSAGMHRFQQQAGAQGLPRMRDLELYCYFVAGVVGEMLTELFCAFDPQIAARRAALLRLAPSFGQGLQMTNILKDIWDDHARGICWLPRETFGLDPESRQPLLDGVSPDQLQQGIRRLAVVAHGHLRNALEYTLLIPKQQRGIRRFCLWALGMAVPTLDNIHARSDFRSGDEVKITRPQVRRIVRRYGLVAGNNWLVRSMFRRASRPLAHSDPSVVERLDSVVNEASSVLEQTHEDSVRETAGAGI
ncbi:MAG: phytoene/squalene synthase family protein [Wenzhouxiangellaceae bacterium]|nr:phytoene/squalene synthase family protein [Wenzhouxiangellaceae bacterium]